MLNYSTLRFRSIRFFPETDFAVEVRNCSRYGFFSFISSDLENSIETYNANMKNEKVKKCLSYHVYLFYRVMI